LPIRRNTPPWDYLHQASIPSLQSYELSRLNHARRNANLYVHAHRYTLSDAGVGY